MNDKEKVMRSIPDKEIQFIESISPDKDVYITTSNHERTMYFLYLTVTGGYKQIMKSKNPLDFNEVIYPDEDAKKKTKKHCKSV